MRPLNKILLLKFADLEKVELPWPWLYLAQAPNKIPLDLYFDGILGVFYNFLQKKDLILWLYIVKLNFGKVLSSCIWAFKLSLYICILQVVGIKKYITY